MQDRVLPYSDTQLSWTFGGPIIKDRAALLRQLRVRARAADLQPLEPVAELQLRPQRHAHGEQGRRRGSTSSSRRRRRMTRARQQVAGATCRTTRATPAARRGTRRRRSRPTGTAATSAARSTQVLGPRRRQRDPRRATRATTGFSSPIVPWPDHPYPGLDLRHADHPDARLHHRPGAHQLARGRAAGHLLVRDNLTLSFDEGGRHDLKVGGEVVYQQNPVFLCNRCMGIYDAQGGPVPAEHRVAVPGVERRLDAGTSPRSRRSSGATRSASARCSGHAPLSIVSGWVQDDWQIGVAPHAESRRCATTSRRRLRRGRRARAVPEGRPRERHQQLGSAARRRLQPDRQRPCCAAAPAGSSPIPARTPRYWTKLERRRAPSAGPQRRPAGLRRQPVQRADPDLRAGRGDAVHASTATPTCLRRSIGTFAAPYNEIPVQQPGVGRHPAADRRRTMAVEADYVYTGNRAQHVSTSTSTSPTTRRPASTIRSPTSAKRPYPDWGSVSNRLSIGESNYHGLQMAFTKRMSDRWQASATYLLAGQWNLQNAPMPAGCEYPTTLNAAGQPVCDVPVTLHPTLREEWYLTGDQRHRVTFNGIWDVWPRHPVQRPVHLRRQRLGDADLGRRRAADRQHAAGRVRADGSIDRAQQLRPARRSTAWTCGCRSGSASARATIDGHRRGVQRLQPRQLRQLRAERKQRALRPADREPERRRIQPRMLQFGFRAAF